MKFSQQILLALLMIQTAVKLFGQTWLQTSAPQTNWWSIACSANGDSVFAVNYATPNPFLPWQNPFFTSTNSGATWNSTGSLFFSNDPVNWNGVNCSADGKHIIVSDEYGQLHLTADVGATWSDVASLEEWQQVAMSADGKNLFAVSTYGMISSTNYGSTWSPTTADPGNGLYWTSITISADGTRVAAATMLDSIVISTNSGTSWQATSAPQGAWRSITSSADGNKLFAAMIGNSYTTNGIDVGTGGIYGSTNGGETWFRTSAPTNGWYAIATSADGATVLASAFSGAVLLSKNSGQSWMDAGLVQTNWASVACSADGNKLFVAVNGAGIWTAQTVPAPKLNLTVSNNPHISWLIPSADFALQQSSDLKNWSNVINAPVLNLANLQNEVVLPLPASNNFFRLKTP